MIYVACVKIGAVMHPVATAMNAADLEYIFNQVGTTAYICPTFSHKTDYELQFQKFRDRVPSLRALLLLDKVHPAHDENAATLSKSFGSAALLRPKPCAFRDDVACILSTSGTTGKPKA